MTWMMHPEPKSTTGKGGKQDHSLNPKKKWRKEGGFDPAVHTPFLGPDSIFSNPKIRVVATCYDSFSSLTFKYPDAALHLSALLSHSIPVFPSVNACKVEASRRNPVEREMVEKAMEVERQGGEGREKEREKRRQKEDEDENYEHAAAAVDDDADPDAPLLFPPFITRRALHGLQADAEKRLHGSQKKKFKAAREKEQEEFKTAVEEMEEASKPTGENPNKRKRQPTAGMIRMKERAAMTDAYLSKLNEFPRTRFHRVIFNFPHTGCGIKDTEQNNAHHRNFLETFFRNIVSNRLVYPVDEHGEIHVTLKKGEPYKSWNIIALSRKVAGLKFKTAVEFYPQLYPGYEHRRTRGFEERQIDLATGAVIGANADIGSGAMTYIFTRERTHMDDEEKKFDAEWIAKYAVQSEQDRIRAELLAECDRIYRETKAKHGETVGPMAAVGGTAAGPIMTERDDDEQAEEEEEDDAADESEEDEENGDEELAAEELAEQESDDGEIHGSADDEDAPEERPSSGDTESTLPTLSLDFAAAFKQHFQSARPPAASASQPAIKKPAPKQLARFPKSQSKQHSVIKK